VKVFNSSVEIHVEKTRACKSLARIEAYSSLHKFCAGQSSENSLNRPRGTRFDSFWKWETVRDKIPKGKTSREKNLVPVRRGVKLNRNRLFFLLDVIPLAVRVPTLCDNLNQDFALWDFRHFH